MPTTITISEFQPGPGECNFLGTTCKLRRYYNQDWTDVDGVFHAEGVIGSSTGFFDEIDCTLILNTITVPAFPATPTDNPQTGSAIQETWQLWDQAGSPRNVIFEGFIPSANPTITFGALKLLNQGQTLFESDAITRLDQWIQSYINTVIGLLNKATSVIFGLVKLSWPAAVTSDPIVYGVNDPHQVPTTSRVYYAAQYDSFDDAVLSMGSSVRVTLVVSEPLTTTNPTVPPTVTLQFIGNGLLTLTTGQTIGIQGPLIAPPVKIFANALSGQGTVSLSGNIATPIIHPEWWGAVTGTSASQSAAFQATVNNAAGRTVQVGPSTLASPWRLDATVGFTSAGGSTPIPGFKLIGTGKLTTVFDSRVANGPMLKVDGNTGHVANTSLGFIYGVSLSDFRITTNSAGANGRGIDFSAVWHTKVESVMIDSLASDAVRINNVGLTDDSESSLYWKFLDNDFRLNGGYAINTNQSSGFIAIGGALIDHNYIAQNTAGGVRWIGSNTNFTHNTFYLNGDGIGAGFGLYLPYNATASTHITVNGDNEFDSNSGGNVRIEGGDSIVVEDNNFNTGNAGVGPNLPLNNVVVGDAVAAVCDRIKILNDRFRSGGVNTKSGIGVYLNPNARGATVGNNFFGDTFDKTTITGTGAVAAGTTVTGTGTSFTSAITVGWWINVGREWRTVASITNDTHLETSTPFTDTLGGSAIRKAQNLDILDLGQDTNTADQRNSTIKQAIHWSTKTVAVAGVTTALSLDDGTAQRLNFTAAGTQTIGAPLVSANSGQTVYHFDLELINNSTNALVVAFDSGWIVGNDFVSPPTGTQTRAHFIYNPGAGNKWTQVGVWTPSPKTNSPPQITSSQNNFNPGPPALYQRWLTDASRNVTGLLFSAAAVDGQTHYIWNIGTQNIVLTNQDAASTAANRFLNTTGADITLSANQMALCVYDLTTARWRTSKMP